MSVNDFHLRYCIQSKENSNQTKSLNAEKSFSVSLTLGKAPPQQIQKRMKHSVSAGTKIPFSSVEVAYLHNHDKSSDDSPPLLLYSL